MKRAMLTALALLVCAWLPSLPAQTAGEPIDFSKAKQLYQKRERGEALSDTERTYLERALAERQKRRAGGGDPDQRRPPERLIPLTDMGAQDRYEGEDGGLYGGGRNEPPEAHRKLAEAESKKIRPLSESGEPHQDGIIGFVALSMSNATQEFSRFKRLADSSPMKSQNVVIVDCAQGGEAMAEWAPANARPWQEALRRLGSVKLSPLQVQIAWVKLANKVPTGTFQEHARKLERDTQAVLFNAKQKFPNLRLVYLGSRIYGGNAVGPLNPEPYAYESAFAARWLIQRQMKGDPNLEPSKAPVLLWGPYLWAEGTKGRKLDSLVWERQDFGPDGVHPSDSGRQKVAELLLRFFTTDPLAKQWFAAGK